MSHQIWGQNIRSSFRFTNTLRTLKTELPPGITLFSSVPLTYSNFVWAGTTRGHEHRLADSSPFSLIT